MQTIHAVCLTGGSAYGLAAADGVMGWLEQQRLGVAVGPDPSLVVPVVPAAVIFDLGRGGRFGHRPDAGFGERAARGATVRQRRWGSVGAGTGARAAGLQGGVGTASTVVVLPGVEIVVGALAIVNANGAVVDPDRGLPWEPAGLRLRRPPPAERRALRAAGAVDAPALNTTIGVVATSARLGKAEAGKLASVAHDGLARAIRPAHSLVDGDTIFALATGTTELPGTAFGLGIPESRATAIDAVLRAGADVFAAACTHAVVAARAVGDAPSYLDLCPSVLPC